MEVDLDPDCDRFVQQTNSFLQWFKNSEATRLSEKIQLVDLRFRGAGRGVIALQDIDEDEEIFAVPKSLVLTPHNALIEEAILQAMQRNPDDEPISPWTSLILAIIHEFLKKENSRWFPYLQLLPTSFDTLMFWSPAELAELEGSAVINKIGKAAAEEDFIHRLVPYISCHEPLAPTNLSDIVNMCHAAGSLIMAYAFDIDRDDESDKLSQKSEETDDEDNPLKGMVPFADMLNADAQHNNARLFQEDEYLIMKAVKTIKAGDEIFNDYGPLPRSDLLRMYGYLTQNYSQYDVVEISLQLLEEVAGKNKAAKPDPWIKRKAQLDEIGLLEDGYAIERPRPSATLEDVIDGQLHMLLRAICLDSESKMPKNLPKEPMTIEEVALLSAVLTKRLSQFSTTIEEDQRLLSLLSRGEVSAIPLNVALTRYKMAVEVRCGEKEVLHQVIGLCQHEISLKTTNISQQANKRKQLHQPETRSNKMIRKR